MIIFFSLLNLISFKLFLNIGKLFISVDLYPLIERPFVKFSLIKTTSPELVSRYTSNKASIPFQKYPL